MEKLVRILEPFKALTLMISRGENSTISKILPFYHRCIEALKSSLMELDAREDIYSGIKMAIDKLIHYYDNVSPIAGIAICLDPSKKASYLSKSLNWERTWIQNVDQSFREAYGFYKGKMPCSAINENEASVRVSPSKRKWYEAIACDSASGIVII
jgi:hypothetical protein